MKILIIYTGGTIGMVRTPNGYAPKEGYFRAELNTVLSMHAEEMPDWELYEMSPLGFLGHDRVRVEPDREDHRGELYAV